MQSTQLALRTLKTFCRCRHAAAVLRRGVSGRLYSTEALAAPLAEGEPKQFSPKLHQIVNDIGNLTLLEVADLNDLLKRELKIQDAPVMAMGAAPMGAPAAAAEEEEEAAPRKEQSLFTVKLMAFSADKKVALIKELKAVLPGINLVQAKKIVESAPVDLKADVLKEEAEQLKKAIEGAGGTVELE